MNEYKELSDLLVNEYCRKSQKYSTIRNIEKKILRLEAKKKITGTQKIREILEKSRTFQDLWRIYGGDPQNVYEVIEPLEFDNRNILGRYSLRVRNKHSLIKSKQKIYAMNSCELFITFYNKLGPEKYDKFTHNFQPLNTLKKAYRNPHIIKGILDGANQCLETVQEVLKSIRAESLYNGVTPLGIDKKYLSQPEDYPAFELAKSLFVFKGIQNVIRDEEFNIQDYQLHISGNLSEKNRGTTKRFVNFFTIYFLHKNTKDKVYITGEPIIAALPNKWGRPPKDRTAYTPEQLKRINLRQKQLDKKLTIEYRERKRLRDGK